MKKTLLFLIILGNIQIGRSQNLVPNPSFETLINCPPGTSGACVFFVDNVKASTTYWQNVGCGSADYFNSCASSGGVSVPFNMFGYQNARTGNAYVGFYVGQNYREYVTAKL